MSKTILPIPDCHVEPNQSQERFNKLGNLILDKKPDIILFMGDFVSLSSLSRWDSDKKLTMEGKRYINDITAANEALDLILKPYYHYLFKCNSYWKVGKAKQYSPKIYYLGGNHEYWLQRYVELNPQMEGHIDVPKDLKLQNRNIEFVPYKKYVEIDNILFTHVPINAAQQPVGGKYALHRALELTAKSIVFAHTHKWEQTAIHRHAGGNLIQALTCGCYFEETPVYAEDCIHSYWKGVSILTTNGKGNFDAEQISLDRIYSTY